MIDTIRIILFLECNYTCSYCCNEKEQFNKLFKKVRFEDIDFTKYKNVCVTGGEPFLKKDLLYNVLGLIPAYKNIYIYTNGTLIDNHDIDKLKCYNIKGINIGLHKMNQLEGVNEYLDIFFNTRYLVQDILLDKFLVRYPDRLTRGNTKGWIKDNCLMPNEEWVLLGA